MVGAPSASGVNIWYYNQATIGGTSKWTGTNHKHPMAANGQTTISKSSFRLFKLQLTEIIRLTLL